MKFFKKQPFLLLLTFRLRLFFFKEFHFELVYRSTYEYI